MVITVALNNLDLKKGSLKNDIKKEEVGKDFKSELLRIFPSVVCAEFSSPEPTLSRDGMEITKSEGKVRLKILYSDSIWLH